MVMYRNGLPGDRAAEEGAQKWVEWLHPRDEDRPNINQVSLIGAKSLSGILALILWSVKSEYWLAHRAGKQL